MNRYTDIKFLIKTLVPGAILDYIKKKRFEFVRDKYYKYDSKRFTIHSSALDKWNKPEKLIGLIIAEYHVIEKGLAMPNMRLGFGINVLKDLIEHCLMFIDKFDSCNDQLHYAIRVIAEYKSEHLINQFVLPYEVVCQIDGLISKFEGIIPSHQSLIKREDFFKDLYADFEKFSKSRHSVRTFTGIIDVETIKKAINLAQSSPSSCNRQPSRVYIVQKEEIIQQILDLQIGNRGFGHLADKLLVVTGELGGSLNLRERNDVFVNGGIYIMNLLYSLHYYQIGACSLNWSAVPEQDESLRIICNIKSSESIIMIIACGGVPDSFKLVSSPRNDYSQIVTLV